MPSTRKTITKTVVDALKPGQTVWDTKLTGFGVRCQRRDRVFVFKCRIGATQRWFTIGKHGNPWTVETARKHVLALQGEIARDGDPATVRDNYNKNPSVKSAIKDFMEVKTAKLRPSTIAQYKDLFDRLIAPAIGSLKIADVQHRDVDRLHHGLRKSKITANRALAALSSLFSWAEKVGHRATNSNPVRNVEKFKEEPRERFLSPPELAAIGDALSQAESDKTISVYAAAAIRLLVLTGARRNEILTLEWDFVDFDRAELRIPESKTGAKVIHLSAPALEILSSLPRIEDNPYVLPGKREGQRLVNLRKPWTRICKAAKLKNVRLHDLRHSFASAGVGGGNSLLMVGKLLGHSNAATTERYSHLDVDPVKAANEEISGRIASMMKGEAGEVVHCMNPASLL